MKKVTIRPVPYENKLVLRNLLNLYVYDLSDLLDRDIGPYGVFDYKYLDHYWTEPKRHAFFIEVENQLAGFALVNGSDQSLENTYSLAEFFILKKYRRTGVGASAAHQIFDQFTGASWEVTQFAANTRATAFWRKAIGAYTDGQYSEKELQEENWRGIEQTFHT